MGTCNVGLVIFKIFQVLNNLFYFIFFTLFIFVLGKIDNIYVLIFLWIYFAVEYILFTLILVFVFCVISYASRIFYPLFFIQIANNFPISADVTETDLQSLNNCKYDNGKFVCSQNKPLPDQSYSNETNCVICFENYENDDDVIILNCHHHYHKKCCVSWLKINKSCPMCRTQI
jgi:hypothetical protein